MCCAAPFRRRPARAVMRAPVRAALARGAGFLALWAAMIGATPADTAVGLVTAAAATWVSLRLLPPGTGRVRWAFLPGLALRFFRQSVLAGIDVAKRALDPSLPLRPRFITYPVRFPPGPARSAFAALTSLLPGSVPAGEDDAAMLYHCLDADQ